MNDIAKALENLTKAIETSAINASLAVAVLGQALGRQPAIDKDQLIADLLLLSERHAGQQNREQLAATIRGVVELLKTPQ